MVFLIVHLMVFLIVSDMHSNLESLDAFLEYSQDLAYDKIVNLGDVVGYNANPNEVVDWVRKNADVSLAGNHDYAVLDKTDTSYFNGYALDACLWTQTVLSKRNTKYLDSLPVMQKKYKITWAHSSPYEPERWHYISNTHDGETNFEYFATRLCFVGHTHLPLILKENPDETVEGGFSETYELESDCRYIINVGSLGQPRDGDPRATFVTYDTKTDTVQYHRYEYPLESTQAKILAAGLPAYLADRLAVGH